MEEQLALFREEQRFTQWWFWLLILACVSPAWYIWWRYLILRRPLEGEEMPDWALWLLWLAVGVLLPAVFASMRLITVVRHDGVYVRFVPFHWRWVKIPAEQIRSVQARQYNPLLEYGGWGIRYGARGKAYNVSGNWGVELQFPNGRTLLIGSQRAEELEKAVREIIG